MQRNYQVKNDYTYWLIFILLLILTFAVYSNSLESSWHLDDYSNIIERSTLHVNSLDTKSLYYTLFKDGSAYKKLYRSIPCLSFAINWYFGKNSVTGYHIVNVFIHFITAFTLFSTLCNIFRTPRLKHIHPDIGMAISVLATVFWAVNPIQVQAVTYIVQRMTSMAAMFYLFSIYFYLKGRVKYAGFKSFAWYTICFFCYLCALTSKENTALLPVSLLLVEILFFRDIAKPADRKTILTISVIGLTLTGFAALFILNGKISSLLAGYSIRPFTIQERLLTEPRVVLFYLSQIFYPVPHRFSIDHDIVVSGSLLHPWTTLPSLLLVIVLLMAGIYQARKRPLFSFGILFFLLNHIVESTIVPLELIFEHRNYLPSLFLYLPVSAGLIALVHYFDKNKFIGRLIKLSVFLVLAGFCFSTYIRNMDWATEKSLWEDAHKKAPSRARAAQNLARNYYFKTGHYDKAYDLYRKSFLLESSRPDYSKALSLNGMASIHFIKKEYEKVIELCQKALRIDPYFEPARYNIILTFITLGDLSKASKTINKAPTGFQFKHPYLFLKGFILLKHNKPDKALEFFRKALKIDPEDPQTILHMGAALSLLGETDQAGWFIKRAIKIRPRDVRSHLLLIENSLRGKDYTAAGQYSEKMMDHFSMRQITTELRKRPNDSLSAPISKSILKPYIEAVLINTAEKMFTYGNKEK